MNNSNDNNNNNNNNNDNNNKENDNNNNNYGYNTFYFKKNIYPLDSANHENIIQIGIPC